MELPPEEQQADLAPAGDVVSDDMPRPEEPKRRHRSFWRELPVLVVVAFGLALLLKTFLVQAFFIPSESMVPTLEVGDRVLVNKLVTRFREPRRGEIIVFVAKPDTVRRSFGERVKRIVGEALGSIKPVETDYIKRVIGLPGETVRVRKGVVTITPVRGPPITLEEPYVSFRDEGDFGPFLVPDEHYFVMGDNRPNSADSRSELGAIPRSRIVGRAFVRLWPVRRTGFFHRPVYD